MKKLLNIALAVIAFTFTACDDVDLNTGIPSVNPPQPVMPADGLEATDIVADGGNVDLMAAKEAGYVDMLDITKLENFPADQELKIVMNVAVSQDMSGARQINLNIADATDGTAIKVAQAPVLEFDQVLKSLVTRDPSVKSTMYVNYVAYALQGSTTVLLGAVGAPQSVVITPLSYEHPVETTYYVYGSINDGTIANAVQLNHDGNQYDNPVFSVKVNITSEQINADGGWKFKVIPASTKQAGQTWEENQNLIFIGAGMKEGTLAYATADKDCEWVSVSTPGEYLLNINVLEQTWNLSNAIEFMYIPGDGNGWSWATKLYTKNYNNYIGFANLKGNFKFTGAAEWDNDKGNYGAGADNYLLQNGSNTNFTVDGTEGLYWMNVNLGALSYTKTYISKVGMVGSHSGWNPATATTMTPSDDNLIWECVVTFTDTDEFKFCMNGNWDIQLAGDENDLQMDGGSSNLKSPGAGTWLVTLDLSALPYQCYFEEQE